MATLLHLIERRFLVLFFYGKYEICICGAIDFCVNCQPHGKCTLGWFQWSICYFYAVFVFMVIFYLKKNKMFFFKLFFLGVFGLFWYVEVKNKF
jgi:hypothetical protein